MNPLELLNKHCIFEDEFDTYILFGIARKKNHQYMTTKEEVVYREVIKDKENIEKKYNKIVAKCKATKGYEFYVYVSNNARDVRKGYIAYKQKLLTYEREILFGIGCSKQLKRLDGIWISALMSPKGRSRHNKRFLLDIDTKDISRLEEINNVLKKYVSLHDVYIQETKNGWHFITPTFDTQKFANDSINHKFKDVCEVKRDQLLFVERLVT